ncbi:MAG: DUF2070 family protein [candidate division KSB1 bacterium]|nr:DUF2070 family protein [candidate division KSB1 bacterium]
MLKLRFDWRDIFRAPRLALSLQRIWIELVGLTIGYAVYLVATFAAIMAAGLPLKSAWLQNGLLPCLFTLGEKAPWYSWVIFAFGCLFLLFSLMLAAAAAARAIYMTSKGNAFYTWKEAYAFTFRKAGSILMTPISLAVIIGLMVLGAWVIGLLGKIPYVGELGVSLFTLIWLFSALLLFFFFIVTIVAAILSPVIITTTDEDAFEAVFQSFSITWSRPWRFLFYEALTIALSLAAAAGLAFFIKEAVVIMNRLFSWFMGADYINLANNGQAMLQSWFLAAQPLLEKVYGRVTEYIYFSREFVLIPANTLPKTVVISSYLYAFSLLFAAGAVVSYALATFTAGNTLLFLLIKKDKDEENLLERKDKEEESEETEEEEKKEDVKTEDEKKEETSAQ